MNTIDKYKAKIAEVFECKPEEILLYSDFPTDYKTKRPFEIDKIEYFKPNGGTVRYSKFSVRKVIDGRETSIAQFSLTEMPSCCAILISHAASVANEFKNRGLGTILNSFRIEIGKELGYSCLMCTDIESNISQRKILKKNGWDDIYSVKNQRTKNNVFLSVINL